MKRSDMMLQEWIEDCCFVNLLRENDTKRYSSIEEYVRFNDRKVLSKVEINGKIYLVLHKKYLDYKEFYERLVELYKTYNNANKGYSRISYENLLKYRTFVAIMSSYFIKTKGEGELSPNDLAKWFYAYNNENLEWNQRNEDDK